MDSKQLRESKIQLAKAQANGLTTHADCADAIGDKIVHGDKAIVLLLGEILEKLEEINTQLEKGR